MRGSTSTGTSHCPYLKSLSNKIGRMLCCRGSTNKYSTLDAKLEKKMIEVKRGSLGCSNFKSIDSIIMRFPQFREELKKLRDVFEQYDEDSNGTIDLEELKKCLQKLQLHLTAEEIEDLFHSCDMDGSEGIQFNKFIVLLCLIYLLQEPSSSHNTSEIDSPQLEATFDTVIEVFSFLDKNGDGKLNKTDMVKALNETSPLEKSPAHVTRTRFSINSFVTMVKLKKWIGAKVGTSVSGSSSLLSSIGLELTQMKKCLQYEVQASKYSLEMGAVAVVQMRSD